MIRPAARSGRWGLLLAAAAAPSCRGLQSTLEPHGPGAERIADLWWLMFWLAAAVAVVSLALLGYALFRRRPATEPPNSRSDRAPTRWILIGGVAVPAVILVFLFVYTLHTVGALAEAREPAVVVEVSGEQWWWRVRYVGRQPHETFETANEIHVPVGERVQVRLRSTNVIHSFWAPGLQGKTDLIPGRTNTLWIQADRAGVYRGQCAEYCGLQHAHMAFLVVAEPPAQFRRWLAHQRRPAPDPSAAGAGGHAHGTGGEAAAPAGAQTPAGPVRAAEDAGHPHGGGQEQGASPGGGHPSPVRGRQVFLASACATCHTIRGTEAGGRFGPDLTHLASRRTLAAVTIPNTKGHLAGWLADPQSVKPGARMPHVPIPSEDFHALLHYLQSLK